MNLRSPYLSTCKSKCMKDQIVNCYVFMLGSRVLNQQKDTNILFGDPPISPCYSKPTIFPPSIYQVKKFLIVYCCFYYLGTTHN